MNANQGTMPAVLITGASSGIGRAAAEYFARKAWRVFATARNPDAAAPLLELAREKNWVLTAPVLDVTSDESVARAVAGALEATGGRLDAVINNAGYFLFGALEETTSDELRAQLETNVIGVHRVTRAVLPAMRARGGGALVTIGSISGRVALPMSGPYHTSKWALEGMIESLRYELIPFGIRVTLIEPGPYKTPFHSKEILAAQSQRPDSPYAPLLAAYRRQFHKLDRAELDPLIEAIYRAATEPDPKLRWPTGPSALSAGKLRALVPDRLFEWLLRLGFPIKSRRA
ncbi:MAG TPA: SDR family oxidoreductase [Polyangia bacterium]|jgi:NAD(P)-dependent dehydrogenase (short-subunit alcohol dehydrogenase family)